MASIISSSPTKKITTITSLGPHALRNLVQEASIDASIGRRRSLDLPGIIWLEHLNLVVGSMELAKKFYVDFLGLTPDSGNAKHFNLGQQQFHLAASDDPAQRVTGSIGLTVPSLKRIRERLPSAQTELEGTLFSILRDGEDGEKIMTVTCPWGNIFHLYDISIDDDASTYTYKRSDGDDASGSSESSQKMVSLHSLGGAYGPHRMAVRGGPGIRYVEVACKSGTVDAIAKFYESLLECTVSRSSVSAAGDADDDNDGDGDGDSESKSKAEKVEAAVVSVGPGVHLAFVEHPHLTNDVIEKMIGVHACIYIPNFQKSYDALKKHDLIWTNPRFTHLDSCDTWEEAYASRTFRFKDILNLETGEKVVELEHETRPMLHGQYLKVPSYVPN